MNAPFSVFTYWDQGIPKIIITMNKGDEIPKNGPSVGIRDGRLKIVLIANQKFELKMPEMDRGDEIPFDIEIFDPETGKSEIYTNTWRAN